MTDLVTLLNQNLLLNDNPTFRSVVETLLESVANRDMDTAKREDEICLKILSILVDPWTIQSMTQLDGAICTARASSIFFVPLLEASTRQIDRLKSSFLTIKGNESLMFAATQTIQSGVNIWQNESALDLLVEMAEAFREMTQAAVRTTATSVLASVNIEQYIDSVDRLADATSRYAEALQDFADLKASEETEFIKGQETIQTGAPFRITVNSRTLVRFFTAMVCAVTIWYMSQFAWLWTVELNRRALDQIKGWEAAISTRVSLDEEPHYTEARWGAASTWVPFSSDSTWSRWAYYGYQGSFGSTTGVYHGIVFSWYTSSARWIEQNIVFLRSTSLPSPPLFEFIAPTYIGFALLAFFSYGFVSFLEQIYKIAERGAIRLFDNKEKRPRLIDAPAPPVGDVEDEDDKALREYENNLRLPRREPKIIEFPAIPPNSPRSRSRSRRARAPPSRR